MLLPYELTLNLPVKLSNDIMSTTTKVWEILTASNDGDIQKVKALIAECPELAYAQYNYTPPIHFAVREGHTELVTYLLSLGAHDPSYRIYPFLEHLETIAGYRGYTEIANQLRQYAGDTSMHKYKGDNGEIMYNKTEEETAFQKAVDKNDITATEKILQKNPAIINDPTFFWGEGIMMMPAKDGDIEMLKLLLQYKAKVPLMTKWGRAYYFKHYHIAEFLMQNGMDATHHSWHNVTLLHDMAQEGDIKKATLLIDNGADVNAVDEEYRLTPLGFAKKWGHEEMVKFLLERGADANHPNAQWPPA
jgi:uncharacterized protein